MGEPLRLPFCGLKGLEGPFLVAGWLKRLVLLAHLHGSRCLVARPVRGLGGRPLLHKMLDSENPKEMLNQLSHRFKELFELQPSKKHLIGRGLGRLEPPPSLKYKAAKVA